LRAVLIINIPHLDHPYLREREIITKAFGQGKFFRKVLCQTRDKLCRLGVNLPGKEAPDGAHDGIVNFPGKIDHAHKTFQGFFALMVVVTEANA
jgi:hypothetical protein